MTQASNRRIRIQTCRFDDGTAIRRWRTGVAHPDELGWLREALQLLTGDDPNDEDDLEPL